MPRNKIVNRRNVTDLKRRTVSISDDAHDAIRTLAAKLHVSQGSLMDAALREFAHLQADDIVAHLARYGHLTPDEAGVVYDQVDKDKTP